MGDRGAAGTWITGPLRDGLGSSQMRAGSIASNWISGCTALTNALGAPMDTGKLAGDFATVGVC